LVCQVSAKSARISDRPSWFWVKFLGLPKVNKSPKGRPSEIYRDQKSRSSSSLSRQRHYSATV
jgi:hypothetical protein